MRHDTSAAALVVLAAALAPLALPASFTTSALSYAGAPVSEAGMIHQRK